MKRIIKIPVLIALIIPGLFIRVGEVRCQDKISLDKAVEAALENHPALKSSELAVQIADQQLTGEKSSLYPEVHSNFSLRRNLIIPSTPVPLGMFQGTGNPNELTFIKFGTDWQSNIGLALNYDIFNPNRKQQIIDRQGDQRLAELDYSARKASVKTMVSKAYAEAVLAAEQLKYAVEDTMLYFEELQVAKDLYSSGRLTDSDLNDAVLQLSQSKSRYSQALSISDQSRIELAYQMGLKPDGPLPETADSLELLLREMDGQVSSFPNPNLAFGYLKLQSRMLQDSLMLRSNKWLLAPTVSLSAGYGGDYYLNSMDFFNANNWYGNSFVALSVFIPLTQEISQSHTIKADRLQVMKNKLEAEDYHNRKYADIRKAASEISSNRANLEQKSGDAKLAEGNLERSHEQYSQGRILPKDLQEARHQFENARVEYLQAAYDLIISELKMNELLETD